MTYKNQVFERESVELDGNVYVACKFLECRLIFSGTAGVSFDDCLFVRCHWSFEGAAAVTLEFLTALNRGTRPGSRNLFDELVDAIKQGSIGRVPLLEPVSVAS